MLYAHRGEGARPFNVVGAVETADDRDHGRGAAPQRAEEPDGENSATVGIRQSPELFLENTEHICGRDRSQRPDDIIHEVGQRKEAGEREHEQHGRKERKKEVVRELSRQAEAVVATRFFRRALEEFAPAQGDVECREHRAYRVQPLPGVGSSITNICDDIAAFPNSDYAMSSHVDTLPYEGILQKRQNRQQPQEGVQWR
jgi:hypothetical protein